MEAVSNSFHQRTMSSFLRHLGAKQMITGDQGVDMAHSGLTFFHRQKTSGLTRSRRSHDTDDIMMIYGIIWVFPKIVGFPPKSSILIGFSIINHPFWGTPIFGNTHT